MQEAQLIKYDAKNPIIKLTTAPAKPVGDHDLLVETKVAAVNPLDNLVAHGDLKLVVPYKLPQTLGNEFVGIVKRPALLSKSSSLATGSTLGRLWTTWGLLLKKSSSTSRQWPRCRTT